MKTPSLSTHQDSSPLRVAVISTGIDAITVPQVEQGWKISVHGERLQVEATQADSVGRGTVLAQGLLEECSNVVLVGIDIFNGQSKTTSTLLLKALEKALDAKCDVVVVCVYSFNVDKGPRFEKVCAYAHRHQIPIIASAVENKHSYPSQIETVLGTLSHQDCHDYMYCYDPAIFEVSDVRRGLHVVNGWFDNQYWGAEMAAMRLGGRVCRWMQEGISYAGLSEVLVLNTLIPFVEFDFA